MTETPTTPIHRAVMHATRDDDEHIAQAARRVLEHIDTFASLDADERAEMYDEINGAGALDARVKAAHGTLTRDEILERVPVDLAYAYVRELYRAAAGEQGLNVMSDLALRLTSHVGHEQTARLN